jgi:hypothetical protein
MSAHASGHPTTARQLLGRFFLAVSVTTAIAATGRPAGAGEPAMGMRMRRAPETSALVAPSVQVPATAGAERVSRDTAELHSEPVSAPAGGVKLNLRGRFQAAVRRGAAADGSAHHSCDGGSGRAHE